MNNIILSAHGKLDNAVMQEWAIDFYSNLAASQISLKEQIESVWFHELFIAQLIDNDETSLLIQLFRELPPKNFFNLSSLIINKWSTWPALLVAHAVRTLSINAPSDLLQLYKDDLLKLQQGYEIDPIRFSSIDYFLAKNENIEAKDLVEKLVDLQLGLRDEFKQTQLLYPLLKLGKQLSVPKLVALLDSALSQKSNKHSEQAILVALCSGLFEDCDYLEFIIDSEEYERSFKLADYQHLFLAQAPLAAFDLWLVNLPKLDEILPILQELSKISEGCRIFLQLLQDSTQIAKLTGNSLEQMALAACIYGYSKSTLDISSFDLQTTIDLLAIDLKHARWKSQLIERLKQFDQSSVTTSLTAHLVEVCDGYGIIHIADAMGELTYPEFIGPMITAMSENKGDYLCESARTALSNIGISAQEQLIEQWDKLDMSQRIYGLSVLKSVPNILVADFVVARFSQLMSYDLESACELILAIPDIRVLELLKPELRRKQAGIERAFYVSARLLNYEGAETSQTEAKSLAEYHRVQHAMATFNDGFLPKFDYLSLELECPSCNAVNRYEVKGVIVSGEGDSHYLLADEFPCVSCGADVEFKFTALAIMALSVELLKISSNSDHDIEPKVKLINCRLDGQILPLPKAVTIIRETLVENPTDAKQWFCLGNLITHINRPKETIIAYRNAVKYMPNAIDAKYALAFNLMEQKQETEAFGILQEALKKQNRWTFLAKFPNFSQSFAELYNHLRRELKLNIAALHPSALEAPKKLGRNDPCLCGSGKKYKKCCG